MTATYKPFGLVFDAETMRPGEQVHAEPDPPGVQCLRCGRSVPRNAATTDHNAPTDETYHLCPDCAVRP